ncbi:MAG: hypothetical protein ACE366_15470 [Bradymonadia bacterium]
MRVQSVEATHTINLRDLLGHWSSGYFEEVNRIPTDRPDPECVVDASGVDLFDTRVLGALLVIRDHLGLNTYTRLPLINLDDEAVRVLRIANFEQLFVFDS